MRAPGGRAVAGCGVTLAGCVVLAGCVSSSSREMVRPTEHLNAQTEDGDLVAEYDLQAGEEGIGEVKVWSHGAYQADVGGVKKTVIRVGFEIQNTGSESLVFDPLSTKIASIKINDTELQNLPVSNTQGSYAIAPKSVGEVDAYFVLPPGVEPQNVDKFDLLWTVNSGGQPYSEFTAFVEDNGYYGYYSADRPFFGPFPYAYDPFYDPLYYDPWYWQYYRPTYVAPQPPGVVVREHGTVREHRQQVRATPQPAPRTVTPPQRLQTPATTPSSPPRQPPEQRPAQPLPSM